MRNKVTTASTARRLLEAARFEILPTATIEDKVLATSRSGRTITVTASPAKGLDPTLALAERLTAAGYTAVPHLAARMISGKAELAEICDRLTAAGITSVFVPAGDQDPPAGDYHASLDLLEDLESLGRPFPHVGITGYPESHPSIHDDVTVQAMWDKRRHATHIVSNLTFDADLVTKWVGRLRTRGVPMPVLIGLPGPVERTKLLTMATRIGVGESTRFLAEEQEGLRRHRHARRLRPDAVHRQVRQGVQRPRHARRGPARLHVQPGRRDREVARRAARAPRPPPHRLTPRRESAARHRVEPGEVRAHFSRLGAGQGSL